MSAEEPASVKEMKNYRLQSTKNQVPMSWVGRRELNPHSPQSQCGALPFELRPTEAFPIVDWRLLIDYSYHPIKIGKYHLAGMTRLELANQLIENQSAFHFAFIPTALPMVSSKNQIQTAISNVFGAREEIRTHQQADLKSAASADWATRARA